MKTAPQIVHEVHGSPVMDGCVEAEGRCWLCGGEMAHGQSVDDWAGASFTGQTRVKCPGATHVCVACVFVCSRLSPVLGRPAKEGKSLGGNFRNFSHLWDESTGYANASKGEKPAIRAFLERHHAGAWFAAIADSGQKHVIPWTPVNPPGARRGLVLFEEQIVTLPIANAAGWTIVTRMAGLLTAGATKEEIERGDYSPRAWQLCPELIRAFEEAWSNKRHSSWFALALWLSQRDEDAVQSRLAKEKEEKSARRVQSRKAQIKDGGGAPGDSRCAPRKPKRQPAEALGHAPDAHARSDKDHGQPGAMGDGAVPRDADPGAQQLGLFGRS